MRPTTSIGLTQVIAKLKPKPVAKADEALSVGTEDGILIATATRFKAAVAEKSKKQL